MRLTTLLPLAIGFLLASCKKEKPVIVVEQPQLKNVTYHVFAGQNYSGTFHENTTADLRLQIRNINYKTGEQQLVWDSVFVSRKLTAFPLYGDRLVIQKSFPVLKSYQKLNGSFSVTYRNNNLLQQTGKAADAGPGIDAVTLEADL